MKSFVILAATLTSLGSFASTLECILGLDNQVKTSSKTIDSNWGTFDLNVGGTMATVGYSGGKIQSAFLVNDVQKAKSGFGGSTKPDEGVTATQVQMISGSHLSLLTCKIK